MWQEKIPIQELKKKKKTLYIHFMKFHESSVRYLEIFFFFLL